jgi:hypothetical protein
MGLNMVAFMTLGIPVLSGMRGSGNIPEDNQRAVCL